MSTHHTHTFDGPLPLSPMRHSPLIHSSPMESDQDQTTVIPSRQLPHSSSSDDPTLKQLHDHDSHWSNMSMSPNHHHDHLQPNRHDHMLDSSSLNTSSGGFHSPPRRRLDDEANEFSTPRPHFSPAAVTVTHTPATPDPPISSTYCVDGLNSRYRSNEHHNHLMNSSQRPPRTLSSPTGIFSPAPSGMHRDSNGRTIRAIEDSPTTSSSGGDRSHSSGYDLLAATPNGSHSPNLRQKLQHGLHLDTPTTSTSLSSPTTFQLTGLGARSRITLFPSSRTSSPMAASAAASSNIQRTLTMTESPQRIDNLHTNTDSPIIIQQSIGHIPNHATGGQPLLPDQTTTTTTDSSLSTTSPPKTRRLLDTTTPLLFSESLLPLTPTNAVTSVSSLPTSIQQLSKPWTSSYQTNSDLDSSSGHKPCNCKKSKCLKLYCECFARNDICRGCNCIGCANTTEDAHKPLREKAILGTVGRDPQAFFRASGQPRTAAPLATSTLGQQPITSDKLAASMTNLPTTLLQQPISTAMLPLTLHGQVTGETDPSKTVTNLPPTSMPVLSNFVPPLPKTVRKGCHCKKSECLKKYCECFQAGLSCHGSCKCVDCKNGDHHGTHEERFKSGKRSKVAKPKGGYPPLLTQAPSASATPTVPLPVNTTTNPLNLPLHLPTTLPNLSGFTPEMFAAHSALMMPMMPFLTNEMMASFWSTNQQQLSQAAASFANHFPTTTPTTNGTNGAAPVATTGTTDTTSASAEASPVKPVVSQPFPSPAASSQQLSPVGSPPASTSNSLLNTPAAPSNHQSSQPIPPTGTVVNLQETTKSVVSDAMEDISDASVPTVDRALTPDSRASNDAPAMELSDEILLVKPFAPSPTNESTPTSSSQPPSTKRSSRIITSTTKAAEWKSAKMKSSKTRLSSTLDQLPAGDGEGRPTRRIMNGHEALLGPTTGGGFTESGSNSSESGNSSGGEENNNQLTLTHRQKRQRHLPQHLLA